MALVVDYNIVAISVSAGLWAIEMIFVVMLGCTRLVILVRRAVRRRTYRKNAVD